MSALPQNPTVPSTTSGAAVGLKRGPADHLSRCPICGESGLDRRYGFERFDVLRCSSCTTAWRSNMYTPDEVVAMYQKENYEEHPFFSYETNGDALERVPRFKRFQLALEALEAETGVGRLLDVGCGAGTFMCIAQSRGWDVQGIELCPPLCELAERTIGAGRVTNAAFEEIEEADERYDAVTMWDVIEHVLDPVAWIGKARALLRPGGVVIVCTPDEESLLAETARALYRLTAGRYYYPALALHPAYHTFFFSGTSLERLFTQHGMDLVRSYSQEAFAAHSPLASNTQKAVIGGIERVARGRDSCYERVVFARA